MSFEKIFDEIERKQKKLWYPEATRYKKDMPTRGNYDQDYPRGAICHFTAGRSLNGVQDAINTLEWGISQGHAYFIIANEGTVIQAHPLNRWGNHAGISYWEGLGENVSQYLVGIEVCCAGKVTPIGNGSVFKPSFNEQYGQAQVRYSDNKDNIQKGHYHKFTKEQEASLEKLILWLKSNNPNVFDLDFVLGHDEVAPTRRSDPGASLSMTMPQYREHLKRRYKEMTEQTEKPNETEVVKPSLEVHHALQCPDCGLYSLVCKHCKKEYDICEHCGK